MQITIRATSSGLIAGQYRNIETKVGERAVFVPLTNYIITITKDTLEITNTDSGAIRKHDLYTKPETGEDKFGKFTKLADAVWKRTDSKGITYLSTYDADQITSDSFVNIPL
jgi:hypothetical protein